MSDGGNTKNSIFKQCYASSYNSKLKKIIKNIAEIRHYLNIIK